MRKDMMIAVLGMGTGAFLYNYCQKHPMNMKKMIENKMSKMKNMTKDFK